MKLFVHFFHAGLWAVCLGFLFLQPASALAQVASGEAVPEPATLEGELAQYPELQSWLDSELVGFRMADLLSAFGILLFALIARGLITQIFFSRLKALAARTKITFDDDLLKALEKPASAFLLLLGVYLCLLQLNLEAIDSVIDDVFRGVSMLLVVWALIRMVDVFGDVLAHTAGRRNDAAIIGFIPLIKKSLRITILVIGLLVTIDNFGYNVTGIIATLGLGGAALALASRDTIANLFGSLMIVLDRPFKVGDWIQVGDKVDGDVESIGLRSTKVRTWPKTVMSIPNSILANEYINNWARMPKRRVKQIVGVTYSTSADDINGLVDDIRQLLREDEGVQQDFILVNFTDFGSSSLDILVYYFTQSTAWLEHMDVRQRINTKIMRAIEARGLSFAFPSRSLYFEGEIPSRLADQYAPLPGENGPEGRLPGDFGPTEPR